MLIEFNGNSLSHIMFGLRKRATKFHSSVRLMFSKNLYYYFTLKIFDFLTGKNVRLIEFKLLPNMFLPKRNLVHFVKV